MTTAAVMPSTVTIAMTTPLMTTHAMATPMTMLHRNHIVGCAGRAGYHRRRRCRSRDGCYGQSEKTEQWHSHGRFLSPSSERSETASL